MASATVRDVLSREFVAVSESDTLEAVAELMLDEGAGSAVVLRGNAPVGMITERDVLAATIDGPIDGMTAVDVMGTPAPTVGPDESLDGAVDVMTTENVRAVVVSDGDGVSGLLTRADIVAAAASLPANDPAGGSGSLGIPAEPTDAAPATTNPVDPSLSAANPADPGDSSAPEESAQGVCEACGRLTRELRSVDGSMLCSDCEQM